jgi:anti-sigma B factor antagonist
MFLLTGFCIGRTLDETTEPALTTQGWPCLGLITRRSGQGVKMSGGSPHSHAAAVPGPQTVVVALPGEIDFSNDGQVQDTLTQALSDGTAVVVADGSRTSFCASSGVSALLAAHRQAATAGRQLRVAASPAMRRVLELTGADHVLDTYPTLTAALAGRARPPAQPPSWR